ncbi:MAG: RluA family pseudouridine synthase [Bacteroidales bacterium]|nr:RluA family pseudouridine synthase [Bacteroidales bacterium]
MPKPRLAKPGAERRPFRPDVILDFKVTEPAGLLDFLLASMPDRKRTTVKDYLKHNQVMVGSTVTRQWDQPLTPGQTVRVNTSREFQIFRNPRLRIVYEDDDIIVVNKGYGLLSMGTDRKSEGTAYWLLRDYVKRLDPRNKIFIVHRLDQQTSGLMMFARTVEAKEAMQHNWNNMVLERTYVAVVEGHIDPPEGTVESYLAENSAHEVYSTDNPAEGQFAVTRYRTVKARGKYSMVELQLETGRKNQIRVHMKDLGHPIVGDRRYGAKVSPIHRLALHARTLRFVHPVTRRDMNFTSEIPAGFARLV